MKSIILSIFIAITIIYFFFLFVCSVIVTVKDIETREKKVKKMINLITDYFDMCKVNFQFFLNHG